MKKSSSLLRLLAAAFASLTLLGSAPASAGYSQLVVFGDSDSDAGNFYATQGGSAPTAAAITSNLVAGGAYSPSGTASNGEVWAQYLSQRMGLGSLSASLLGGTDYAFSGAFMASPGVGAPSLSTQVDQYLATSGTASGDALYVIEGGTNDLHATAHDALVAVMSGQDVRPLINDFVTQYVTDTLGIVAKLKASGAQNILVWDLSDVSVTPIYMATTPPALLPLLSSVVRGANMQLANALAGVSGVTVFDVGGLMDNMVADPAAFGLVNTTDACLLGSCDASTNMFWDGTHFTTATHQIIADAAFAAMDLPEPGSLVLTGMALAALRVQRRSKQV